MTTRNLKGLEGTKPCPSRKIAYPSESKARAALRELSGRKQSRVARTGVDALESQRVYECDECSQWHTTSQPLKSFQLPVLAPGYTLGSVVEALIGAMRGHHSGLVFPTGGELSEAYPPFDGYGLRSHLVQKGWLDLGPDGMFLTRKVQRTV